MALLYRYTANVAPALVGGTPWDTARTGVTQEATPATRQAIYDAIADALYDAGWTRYDRNLSGASANTNRDDVWFSDGESGGKHIVMRTALSDSGAAGSRYLWWTIAPMRDDSATALNVNGTWNGTTTVALTDTSQLRARGAGGQPGSFIREDADGQWFEVTAINTNVDVTIDAAGFTIPNAGSAASSVLTPILQEEVGSQAFTNATPFNNDQHRWDLGASDFSADFHLVVDKNFLNVVVQNVNHTANMFSAHIGDAIPYDCNPNVMVAGASVAAGDQVEVLTEDGNGVSVDPRVLGYRELDVMQIVNVDPNGTPRAETQVVTRVQSDRVTFKRLRYSYDGDNNTANPRVFGARLGQAPCPIMKTIHQNSEIEEAVTSVNVRTPFIHGQIDRSLDFPSSGDFVNSFGEPEGIGQYFIHYAQLVTHAQTNDEYGSGISGNERTLRFTTRTLVFGTHSITGFTRPAALIGKIPRLASYNGTVSFYPHDNMKRDRVTPNEDFVPFRFTATSTRNYVMGPTPGP